MGTAPPPSSFLGCLCHRAGAPNAPASARRRLFTGLALASAAAPALASIPECRRSRAAAVAPASYVESMAQQQYAQILRQAQQQRALATGGVQLERLRDMAARMVPFAPGCNERARQWRWEVNLLGSSQINAFCMPGGKIAFFTGILARLKLDDDEVAMIMGHEIAHALLEHARERLVKAGGTELLLRGGAALLGLGSLGDAAAAGASQLLGLKYSRDDESEADALGLIIAAQAGYDPRAGVTLWQKMIRIGGDQPPPWLSTHPAGERRIADIQARLPQLTPVFERAPKPPRRFGPPA
ncbi:MAG: M48 family metallopeptidase [Ideonella sp. WA131b]|jgi:predicted Zn-dependent protease|nr:M48 family metallopeptidase [Ideonella sp. WA131b]